MVSLRPQLSNIVGGEWHGLLFDNPATGRALTLTWSFRFDFAALVADREPTTPALALDWVVLDVPRWSSMSGAAAHCERFADPIEASVYVHDHHRFERAAVEVRAQQGGRIHVAASVDGDLDGLGIETLAVDGWLGFGGIYVQPSVVPATVDGALRVLAQFTDATDLVGTARSHNHVFRPDLSAG